MREPGQGDSRATPKQDAILSHVLPLAAWSTSWPHTARKMMADEAPGEWTGQVGAEACADKNQGAARLGWGLLGFPCTLVTHGFQVASSLWVESIALFRLVHFTSAVFHFLLRLVTSSSIGGRGEPLRLPDFQFLSSSAGSSQIRRPCA